MSKPAKTKFYNGIWLQREPITKTHYGSAYQGYVPEQAVLSVGKADYFHGGTLGRGSQLNVARKGVISREIKAENDVIISFKNTTVTNATLKLATDTQLRGTVTFSKAVTLENAIIDAHADVRIDATARLTGCIRNKGRLTVLGTSHATITNTNNLIGGHSSLAETLLSEGLTNTEENKTGKNETDKNETGTLTGFFKIGKALDGGNLVNATVTLIENASIRGTVTLDQDSTLTGGRLTSGSMLRVSKRALLTDLILDEDAQIVVTDIVYEAGEKLETSGNMLQILDKNHRIVWSMTLRTDQEPFLYALTRGVDGRPTITPIRCFLAGTRILMSEGERLIETLEVGDKVTTFKDGVKEEKAITWIGSRSVCVRSDLPDDVAGRPIRLSKDCLEDGVPHTDLVITPEHCLYIAQHLVPARLLVNGFSIAYDRSISTYTCYHFEVEEHAVVQANGVLTETLYDTNRKSSFTKQHGVTDKAFTVERPMAAPLGVERSFVEPLFNRIFERACHETHPGAAEAPGLTESSAFCARSLAGNFFYPRPMGHGFIKMILPPGVDELRLISRCSRPCDVGGAFIDDRRVLGVLVAEISLHSALGKLSLDTVLKDESLRGWHNVEPGGSARWTSGEAQLILPRDSRHLQRVIIMRLIAGGPYRVTEMRKRAPSEHPLPASNEAG